MAGAAENMVKAELMAWCQAEAGLPQYLKVLVKRTLRSSTVGQMRRMRWRQWEIVVSFRCSKQQ